MSDGSEPQNRLVLGVRARYSMSGGTHRIEALLLMSPWRVKTDRTSYYTETQTRSVQWEVWHTVYVGLDYDAARAHDDRLNKLMEQSSALTE